MPCANSNLIQNKGKNSPVAKLVAGVGISTIGVEDKFNAQRGSLNAPGLPLANPGYFTPEKMQGWLAAGSLAAIFSLIWIGGNPAAKPVQF